jgi:hypothetical protein
MSMRCRYYEPRNHCERPPTNIFVWGCKQNHIFEFISCHEHAHRWIQEFRDGLIQCAYCMENALDYIVTGVELLTPEYQVLL